MITSFCYSQLKGKYSINEDIEITHIKFEKSLGNVYSKSLEKKLTGLEFILQKKRKSTEKECYLIRYYNYETALKDLKVSKQNKEQIDIEYFYELVEKLNKMNTDKLLYDFNVADGISRCINFSGGNFNVEFCDNWEDENKSDFYSL